MWETFSQRLSISIIHAFAAETACVNNSKKELDYNKIYYKQFDRYTCTAPHFEKP